MKNTITKPNGKTTHCPDVKKRGNHAIDASRVEKTEMSRVIEGNYGWFKGRVKPQSEQELEIRIRQFFEGCLESGQYPTYEKLALSLHTTVKTLYAWETRTGCGVSQEWSNLIADAKALIQAIDAELALKGEINNITWIFRAKNYYGMKDQQDLTISANPIGNIESKEKLLEQIEQLPD